MATVSAGYTEYIQSNQWRAKRRRFLATRDGKCEGCGATRNLHVHHASYRRFTDERLSDLRLVCQSCHTRIHDTHKANPKKDLWRVTRDTLKRIRKAAHS